MADAKNTRLLPAVPVVDRVPLMVWRESKVNGTTPADAGPVTDRLLKVFELPPVIALVAATVEVKLTLLNVTPPLIVLIVAPCPVRTIVDVPAFNVDAVANWKSIAVPTLVMVNVEAFKFKVLVTPTLQLKRRHVNE